MRARHGLPGRNALTFAGARDRQAQLGLDVAVPGGGLQLKAGTRGTVRLMAPLRL
jgi:hypothetical protein